LCSCSSSCGYKSGDIHSPWVSYEWYEKGKYQRLSKKIVTREKEAPITLAWKDKFMGKSGGTKERRDISETIEVQFFMDIKSSERNVKKTRFLMEMLTNAK
jgi:hypothetical protein